MKLTETQTNNLNKVISEVVAASHLARFRYQDNECYCIIGHLAKEMDQDLLCKLTENPYYNQKGINFFEYEIKRMNEFYGLSHGDILDLQDSNDYGGLSGDKYGDKKAVLDMLENIVKNE